MLQTPCPHGFHYSVVILLLLLTLPVHIAGQLDVFLGLPRFFIPSSFIELPHTFFDVVYHLLILFARMLRFFFPNSTHIFYYVALPEI